MIPETNDTALESPIIRILQSNKDYYIHISENDHFSRSVVTSFRSKLAYYFVVDVVSVALSPFSSFYFAAVAIW